MMQRGEPGKAGSVWVFSSTNSRFGFPSAVFSAPDLAEAWIQKYELTGTLTEYPVDVGVYDWAVETGFYEPGLDEDAKRDKTALVGGFSSEHQLRYLYVSGKRQEDD